MKNRAEQIMLRMGFPASECGPYVMKLRSHILEQVQQGLQTRSGGTWVDDARGMSHEDRAREILAVDWEIEHGHGYRVEALDGFGWRYFFPWIGDRIREVAMHLRIWRDRNRVNPYLSPHPAGQEKANDR